MQTACTPSGHLVIAIAAAAVDRGTKCTPVCDHIEPAVCAAQQGAQIYRARMRRMPKPVTCSSENMLKVMRSWQAGDSLTLQAGLSPVFTKS